ncbi:DUF4173 domain-containing protein [Subsaximicrobium wynnwilliamsii]|uniref:DUF4173 domain-containing protein n=1 Tax=Subsaximicrobium wynnwilliamsii TaxID=291179 RepID=A0A5C6ZAZ8_9FLAO|nr:DUF4153 domain-containing protein [Subsaximicrobium wynnwilliamsii]TXD82018.1 DUF4173 domain-containing protein [Subsaximicrobium wynnwilliamsii]TXD86896.1 DUF4173 domain-containing protein [Subsaximicrobium wynnwilliamsii]TXE01478.1 DUF4173 domain-containing protein [Subsaximicrobium wynnwilliamsii]
MKQIVILIAAVLFSLLFYGQSVGLNLALFAVLALVLLLFYNLKKFRDRGVLLHSVAYLLSAVLVFVHRSSLSVMANLLMFVSLVGAVSESQSSIYLKWLNGLYTSIAGFFHRNIDRQEASKASNWKQKADLPQLAKLIGIPIVFIILFVLLYRQGNPVFEGLIARINFDFINLQWLLFTLMGYYLFSNIAQPVLVEPATSADLSVSNNLLETANFSEASLKKEQQLGTTLLGLLNLLLLVYILTDIISINAMIVSKASELSIQVHNGINTLIASIIIAIIIILYFFRGNLNFYAHNRILKNLSFLWISLNVALIVLIAIKNQNYIGAFGLTYKRIGVYVYIFMTLIGLLTTFLKVLNLKNLAFLFRSNTQVAFMTLLLLSGVNWDRRITQYNLTQAQDFDMDYLIKLSNRNAILLYDLKDSVAISETQKRAIEKKYQYYIQELQQRNWQELNYDNFSLDLLKTESNSVFK